MTWQSDIEELVGVHRMTQQQIAAHCECGQSAISLLAQGKTKDPSFSVGTAIKELLHQKRRERGAAAEDVVVDPPPAAPADGAAAGVVPA